MTSAMRATNTMNLNVQIFTIVISINLVGLAFSEYMNAIQIASPSSPYVHTVSTASPTYRRRRKTSARLGNGSEPTLSAAARSLRHYLALLTRNSVNSVIHQRYATRSGVIKHPLPTSPCLDFTTSPSHGYPTLDTRAFGDVEVPRTNRRREESATSLARFAFMLQFQTANRHTIIHTLINDIVEHLSCTGHLQSDAQSPITERTARPANRVVLQTGL